jgi:hypothetical protein
MFLLPNKKSIDDDGLEKALCDLDQTRRYFLDSVTGEVGCVDVKDVKKLRGVSDRTRYFEVPKISEKIQLGWVKSFTDFLSFDESGLSLQCNLREALKNGKDLGTCLKMIKADKNGWIDGWYQWNADSVGEKMDEWFPTLPIEIIDDWDLDDDCELCKMMKSGGGHTLGDFKEAAAKEELKKKKALKKTAVKRIKKTTKKKKK